MDNFGFNEMQEIQKELQEKYKDEWGGLSPEKAADKLLGLYGEVGEVVDVIRKDSSEAILSRSFATL